jgi:hypothetical protein
VLVPTSGIQLIRGAWTLLLLHLFFLSICDAGFVLGDKAKGQVDKYLDYTRIHEVYDCSNDLYAGHYNWLVQLLEMGAKS